MSEIRKKMILRNLDETSKAIILLLYVNEKSPIERITHLKKEVFLLSRKYGALAEDADFKPFLYGPESEKVQSSLDMLESFGLVDKGKIIDEELVEELVKRIIGEGEYMVNDFEGTKSFLEPMSNKELLTYIYSLYSEYTTKSVVRDDFERDRIKIAKVLYKKGKVSLSKALDVAGQTFDKFKEEL